jgi:hypothetical protein
VKAITFFGVLLISWQGVRRGRENFGKSHQEIIVIDIPVILANPWIVLKNLQQNRGWSK